MKNLLKGAAVMVVILIVLIGLSPNTLPKGSIVNVDPLPYLVPLEQILWEYLECRWKKTN